MAVNTFQNSISGFPVRGVIILVMKEYRMDNRIINKEITLFGKLPHGLHRKKSGPENRCYKKETNPAQL
jgi:hypothetical protein